MPSVAGHLLGNERIVRDQAHAKRPRARAHFLPDAPEPDDAERLAAQLAAGELLLLPDAALS